MGRPACLHFFGVAQQRVNTHVYPYEQSSRDTSCAPTNRTKEPMSFEASLTFLIAIFIFGITPGPGVFALLARGMASGAASCFALALGMAISDIGYLIMACYGLATIAENWSGLFMVVRLVGAAYLIYLGWKMWTAPVDPMDTHKAAKNKGGEFKRFSQGFLISASNPKVILFYIAFLPTFMDLTQLTGPDIALVSVLTLIGLMLSLMLIAFSASSARACFQSTSAVKWLNRTAGAIMMSAGGYLATRG